MQTYTCPQLYVKNIEIYFLATLEIFFEKWIPTSRTLDKFLDTRLVEATLMGNFSIIPSYFQITILVKLNYLVQQIHKVLIHITIH